MMKRFVAGLTVVLFFISCSHSKKNIVDPVFIDSFINNYKTPVSITANATDIDFWKTRINPNNPGITNETRYASALASRFNLLGDIHDLLLSDSILVKTDSIYNHREPGPLLALVSHAIMQHKFRIADSILEVAKRIGLKKYESITASFDVDFELGRYDLASSELNNIRSDDDYGYNFRKSKLAHYKGNIDTAISAMLKAFDLSESIISLKQAALSNAADLYLHSGKFKEAYNLYHQSILMNGADNHSLLGIGWIVLVHDKNDSLAERLFQFVHSKTKAADPVFKLIQVGDARNDSLLERLYAADFTRQVTNPVYGGMYNKYLIELYTGILEDPAEAELLARTELNNRATPQTYAWYAWSLFANNKKDEAYKVFLQYVSGKPLESLELYWMGKMMLGLGKGYNAQQFFKAANDNRYDLSPSLSKDLDKLLSE